MALAQTDCPKHINMKLKWINDPNIPYDSVNPINHCALFFVASKHISTNSKLCWHYPMVHQVMSCIICLCTSNCPAGGSFETDRERYSPENSSVQAARSQDDCTLMLPLFF
jgi:hypothetical protein